jgi:hypothetical protein
VAWRRVLSSAPLAMTNERDHSVSQNGPIANILTWTLSDNSYIICVKDWLFYSDIPKTGKHASVVCWGAMLHAGRLWVRFVIHKFQLLWIDGCRVVSAADPLRPYSRFLDRSRYLFFQAAPQLYLGGWVNPLLLRKSGRAGIEPKTSGFVASNSDHYATEAVYFLLHNIYIFSSYLTANTIHLRCVARNSDH